MALQFYNTLTRRKDTFTPMDEKNVRMYVCGPTVYDRPHLGNARSVVVYDVMYRLLCHLYGKEQVKYVRNITDVDDKINARAKERGITIRELTDEVTAQFHEDMGALNCLRPTVEPRATEHIAEMHAIIEKLMANGHAYVRDRHVLFDVASVPHYRAGMGNEVQGFAYGMLSHRVQDDLVAGARVEVESYKKNPGDFVLWKPAEAGDDPSCVFDSPWGKGRPGWHIECSAMSARHLGDTFDLHGGGADLMFPHHENEIAQSRCASKDSEFARMWVHNGFLTVGGEKMSKSLGNFTAPYDLLQKGVKGEVIRLALLSAHYRAPLDWSDKLVEDAKKTLDSLYRRIADKQAGKDASVDAFVAELSDDLNLSRAISQMHLAGADDLRAMGRIMGILQQDPEQWFKGGGSADDRVVSLIDARIAAKKAKNWAEADRIRKELADAGIVLEDKPDGTTDWRRA
jgi:cysteinyl-tRNA synthetase